MKRRAITSLAPPSVRACALAPASLAQACSPSFSLTFAPKQLSESVAFSKALFFRVKVFGLRGEEEQLRLYRCELSWAMICEPGMRTKFVIRSSKRRRTSCRSARPARSLTRRQWPLHRIRAPRFKFRSGFSHRPLGLPGVDMRTSKPSAFRLHTSFSRATEDIPFTSSTPLDVIVSVFEVPAFPDAPIASWLSHAWLAHGCKAVKLPLPLPLR
ncbi:hypothetical protein C8R45DRAFT_499017 [Mycena sanguinolenta]|nr:hypothetical protein C8R45DRAFT_499017 [Mycena sanguinolenta]